MLMLHLTWTSQHAKRQLTPADKDYSFGKGKHVYKLLFFYCMVYLICTVLCKDHPYKCVSYFCFLFFSLGCSCTHVFFGSVVIQDS